MQNTSTDSSTEGMASSSNATTMVSPTILSTVNSTDGLYNVSSSPPESENSWIDPNVIQMIGYVTVPLFFVVGFIGNMFSISVMQTKYFRQSTICIYLTALGISDTTFILVGPFTKTFIKELFGRDPKALTVAGCKAFFCIFRTAKICSSWFVVTLCIERFIVVWFPLRVKFISNRRSALISVLSVTVSVFIFDGAWTITSDIVNGNCVPSVVTDSTRDISTGFVIAGTAIFNIIPTVVLLIFTPLTAFKLFRQQSFRRTVSTLSAGGVDAMRITRMLVSIMCAYIVLVTPISIAHSVAFFNDENIFEYTNPSFVVFREFAQILEQLNYCINFFLYISFNSTFRRSFRSLFGCRSGQANTRGNNSNEQSGNDINGHKHASISTSSSLVKVTDEVIG